MILGLPHGISRVLLLFLFFIAKTRASDAETKLFADLLTGLNPLERPVENASDPLVVKMKIFLQQILDVDEKNQLVSVNAWLRFTWTDYKLKWNPRDYNGIPDVRFPGTTDHIWKPDVLLYNSAAEDFDSTFKSNLLVYNTGDVTWIPPGVLKFVCAIDVTWFPFDEQLCELKFGSWTFHGHAIDLQIDSSDETDNTTNHQMDLSTYVVNGEWSLINSPAIRKVCAISRPKTPSRSATSSFNLIIPSLLITLMTVLGFTLPPDAGEKINLEMTVLLAIVFFLSMVSEMTPPTSEAVPLIGVFFSCCMLVISASVVFTVVILNLHFRGPDTHVMSPLVRSVLLEWLPWILMMSRPGHTFRKGCALKDGEPKLKEPSLPINRSDLPAHQPVYEAQLLLLHSCYSELKQITAKLEKEAWEERVQNDWRFAAMAVDRACLVMFSLFIVISTLAIMLSAPHLIA
ncbi:unnamed protein product, partial [Mesorhabditis spiculigera]